LGRPQLADIGQCHEWATALKDPQQALAKLGDLVELDR
jgi:hypothetical protein